MGTLQSMKIFVNEDVITTKKGNHQTKDTEFQYRQHELMLDILP